jgi:hypothetical protein
LHADHTGLFDVVVRVGYLDKLLSYPSLTANQFAELEELSEMLPVELTVLLDWQYPKLHSVLHLPVQNTAYGTCKHSSMQRMEAKHQV